MTSSYMPTKNVLDAHTYLWSLAGSPRLGASARAILQDPSSELILTCLIHSSDLAGRRCGSASGYGRAGYNAPGIARVFAPPSLTWNGARSLSVRILQSPSSFEQ